MSADADRNDRCGTCRYWVQESSECRRRAPSAVAPPPAPGVWPLTAADQWCGEWAAAAKGSEPAVTSEPASLRPCVATSVFLARVAPMLDAGDPMALLESLLEQVPSDVRRVLVRANGLDGRPRAGPKDVARELKMSLGYVHALLAAGEKQLTEVVQLLTRQRATFGPHDAGTR